MQDRANGQFAIKISMFKKKSFFHYTYSQGDTLNTDFEENYHDFFEMVRSAFFKTDKLYLF